LPLQIFLEKKINEATTGKKFAFCGSK